ncbi:EpsG family protein [Providencia rettgeri]|nr:EpsG family protein [Providencia rettgeri]
MYKIAINYILFLFNPFISVFSTLLTLDLRRKSSILLLSLSAAIISIGVVPVFEMDLVRYYESYEKLVNVNIFDIFSLYHFNLLVKYYVKLLSLFGIDKEFIPFIPTFLAYYLLLYSLKVFTDNIQLSKKEVLYYVLAIFFAFPFMSAANGIRSGVAISIFIFGLAINSKSKTTSLIIFLIASFVHSFVLAPIFLFLLSKFKLNSNLIKVLIISTPIPIAFGGITLLVNSFVSILPYEISTYIHTTYITGEEWGKDVSHSFTATLANVTLKSSLFYCCIFYSLFYNTSTKIKRFFALMVLFSLWLWEFGTISGRYQVMTTIILPFVILESSQSKEFYINRFKVIVIICGFLATLYSFYTYRYVFYESYLILVKPSINIFFIPEVEIKNLIRIE